MTFLICITETQGHGDTNEILHYYTCYQLLCVTLSGRIKGILRMCNTDHIVIKKANVEPPLKCRKVSLSLPKDCFDFSVDAWLTKRSYETYSVKNMAINNKWALKNFEDWFNGRSRALSIEPSKKPLEVLLTDDPSELCHIFSMYV